MLRIEIEVDARDFADTRTFAPRFANSNAICVPMPRDAPVTIATLPERVSGTGSDDGMVDRNRDTMSRLNNRGMCG